MTTNHRSVRRLDRASSRRVSKAFTLVELLIALVVISVLAAIALPTTKTMLKEQRVSRGASQLQAAIGEARARAIANGGGGLIIRRSGVKSVAARSQATLLQFASTPPSYSGDPGASDPILATSIAALSADGLSPARGQIVLWFSPAQSVMFKSGVDVFRGDIPTLINEGDLIQIGSVGVPTTIRFINRDERNQNYPALLPTSAQRIADFPTAAADPFFPIPDPPTDWTRVVVELPEPNSNFSRLIGSPIEFSVQRSPRPSIAPSIQLTKGTAIDLTASGIGKSGNQFSPFYAQADPRDTGAVGNYTDTTLPPFEPFDTEDYLPIYILFNERGEVSRVARSARVNGVMTLVDEPVLGDIYLLLHESGNIKTDPEDQLEDNDLDPLSDAEGDGTTAMLNRDAIWVTIRSRTGEVIASPWVDPTETNVSLIPPVTAGNANAVQQSRIQSVLTLTRTAAAQLRDSGSE